MRLYRIVIDSASGDVFIVCMVTILPVVFAIAQAMALAMGHPNR